jgi:hypothetical protein
MVAAALDKENEVEAKKPLQACAAIFQFDFFWSTAVANPNAEMVSICLKFEGVDVNASARFSHGRFLGP